MYTDLRPLFAALSITFVALSSTAGAADPTASPPTAKPDAPVPSRTTRARAPDLSDAALQREAAARAASANDVQTLSPFEVNMDRDVGYIAANSLAGGRLNTDLRDTAVAISVFTKDFLDDIGVRTVNDALEYGLNTATEYDAT